MRTPQIIICENDFVHFKYDHTKKILFITPKGKEPTESEWKFLTTTIIEYYDTAICTNHKFSMLIDTTNINYVPLSLYDKFRIFFTNLRSKTEICINGTAIIAKLLVLRVALNAFFTIYTPARPVSFESSIEDSEKYLESIGLS